MAEDDIRDRILDAAKELIEHYGYDKTTVSDIAKTAGISKSTLYTRWNKKEDIFDALLWRESRTYIELWFQRVMDDPQGGTYGGWMRHALVTFLESPFLSAIYSRNRRIMGSMLERIGSGNLFQQRQMLMMNFYRRMQEAGVVREDIDPQALTYLLNSTQLGLIRMNQMMPEDQVPPMDQVFGVMVEMIERMVTTEDGGNSQAGKAILRDFMEEIRAHLDYLEQSSAASDDNESSSAQETS